MPPEALVSPFVGIVRGVQEVLAGPEDLRLATAWCETAFVETGGAYSGAGSAATFAAARTTAICEAAERYSASIPNDEAIVLASARDLGESAVDPERFALFSERQYRSPGFGYVRFDRDTRLGWVEGRSLPDGRPAWLPAQLVHLAGRDDEPQIAQVTSSGLACGATIADATLAALLELIERDAFMITWKARLSFPLLDGYDASFVAPTGLAHRVVDLSAFWDVPCAAAVVRSTAPDTAPLGVGAAAAPTIERAAAKALDEATRVRTWAEALRRGDVPMPERVATFEDHIRVYAEPGNVARTRFLDASRELRHVGDVASLTGTSTEARIAAICRRLAHRGASAYAVDVTSPDVAAAGLAVVRVIAPELCALDVEHDAPLLGGRRLYEEPRRLGMRGRVLTEDDVNPDPHPFP